MRASGTHASELEMRHKKDGGGSEEPKDPPPPFFAHETLKIENLSYLLSFFRYTLRDRIICKKNWDMMDTAEGLEGKKELKKILTIAAISFKIS